MAEGTHREDSEHTIDPEKHKYMRLMQVGWACIVAWPVGIILASMYGLDSIIPQVSVLLVGLGVILFAIGYVSWQELRERRRAENQEDNK